MNDDILDHLIEAASEAETAGAIGYGIHCPRRADAWGELAGELLAFVLQRWGRMDSCLTEAEAERFVGLCEQADRLLPAVLKDYFETVGPPDPYDPGPPAPPFALGEGPYRNVGIYPAKKP